MRVSLRVCFITVFMLILTAAACGSGKKDSAYASVLRLKGVTILGTAGVDKEYLEIAAEVYRHMTSRREPFDIPALHEKSGFKIILVSGDDRFSDLPEYAGQGRGIDRAAGLGGQIGEFFIGVRAGSPHTLVHELGHGVYHSAIQFEETGGAVDEMGWHAERVRAVHGMEINEARRKLGEEEIHEVLLAAEGTFSAQLAAAWRNADEKGLWEGTYAGLEPNEYWAEGVTMFFRAYGWDDIEGDSRLYLQKRDPMLYELCASIFPSEDWEPRDALEAAGVSVPFSEEERHANMSAGEFFAGLDHNGDGVLSGGEILKDEREFFDMMDADGDGRVSREEFLGGFDETAVREE